jgi:hypothetical protein
VSVFSWLRPAMLVATVVVASSLLAPAPLRAQEVTILRGSPAQPREPYAPVPDDNQSSNYSPSGYGGDYPYYGDDFPVGIGRGFHGRFDRGFHRRFRRGLNTGFHGGASHGGFQRGFSGGFHGGGGHR